LTLRLKVGRKGYIILPKAVREAVGIKEGDEVTVEIRDGILLKPVRRKIDRSKIRSSLKQHLTKLASVKSMAEPKLGDLTVISLEEEFG